MSWGKSGSWIHSALRKVSVKEMLVLNAVLACVLAATLASRTSANAQQDGQPQERRARGEYTMVSGRTNQGGPQAVWLIDSANQELVVLRWDQTKQNLVGSGYRNLAADAKLSPGR